MTDLAGQRAVPPSAPAAGPASGGAGSRRFRRAGNYLALVPFHAYVGALPDPPDADRRRSARSRRPTGSSRSTTSRRSFTTTSFVDAFVKSIQLAVATALAGAILGGLLAWAVVARRPERAPPPAGRRRLRRARPVRRRHARVRVPRHVRLQRPRHDVPQEHRPRRRPADMSWLYSLTGLAVVYTYFQIPLMLIVFLPSLDGLRQEWYDASASLGGGAWSFWRHVGGPILAPSFLGALLLLFTNAFSAYATAAALDQPGQPDRHPPDRQPVPERGRARPGERRQGAGAGDDRRRRRS